MPRFASLAGLSLAALITLTACSSSPDAGEASISASTGTPAAPSDGPSSEPSTGAADGSSPEPSTGAADGGTEAAVEETGTYSSVELSAILGSVTQTDGSPLQIIPTAQIEQSMSQARQFLDSVTVTPEECEVFVSNSLDAPEGAGVATGVSSADGDAVQTIVSAASAADIASSEEDAAETARALAACSSISVEAQGVAIEQTVEAVDATTDADGTVGTVTAQTSSDGAKQQTMTIVGTRGDLAVTAVRTARNALPDGTQEELQDLVDATLAAARQG